MPILVRLFGCTGLYYLSNKEDIAPEPLSIVQKSRKLYKWVHFFETLEIPVDSPASYVAMNNECRSLLPFDAVFKQIPLLLGTEGV